MLLSVILAVKKRFKKTLRNGWSAFLKYYNRKFRRTVNNFVLKKSIQNEAENEIKQEEFGDRRRISTYCTEQFSLTVTTLCINPIEKFICEMKKISETEIRDVGVLTRKFLMNWCKVKNVFWGADDMCQYLNKSADDVDHLATRYEKILYHDYTSVIMKSKTLEEILENEACGDESAYQEMIKYLNTKDITPLISKGGTKLEEQSVNINEGSDEEKTVVEQVERNLEKS
ncbi:hypothetical protein CWI36_0251p0020 [Hamiltosporidium magnivora]|uniref:Uncharacterized protein n=1 Tax=Hamiltosporidium magnivora TaxID=148818 RepID=A0A4Q9LHK1_9MICR|nr:hypothetical protein CWI36_0251p0020 [Hamiltosporidium magnivora]